jgi:hypothetical protein
MNTSGNPTPPFKSFLRYRLHSGIVSLMLIAATFCNCPGPNAPSPRFSDLSPLAGKRYVAYTSPDATKPDTIIFSWKYPGINFGAIKVIAILDSGATQIPVTDFISIDADRALLRWVPGADTLHFGYFGIKTCILHLSDTQSGYTTTSDSFTIIGSRPLIIQSPSGGAHYSLNDTIAVDYQINSDRISNIRVFFRNDSMENWMEITGTTKRSADNPPFRSFSTLFIPRAWSTAAPLLPGTPLRFLCKDYNSPLPNSSSISGDIFVD